MSILCQRQTWGIFLEERDGKPLSGPIPSLSDKWEWTNNVTELIILANYRIYIMEKQLCISMRCKLSEIYTSLKIIKKLLVLIIFILYNIGLRSVKIYNRPQHVWDWGVIVIVVETTERNSIEFTIAQSQIYLVDKIPTDLLRLFSSIVFFPFLFSLAHLFYYLVLIL